MEGAWVGGGNWGSWGGIAGVRVLRVGMEIATTGGLGCAWSQLWNIFTRRLRRLIGSLDLLKLEIPLWEAKN